MSSRFEAGLRKNKFVSLLFFLCDKAGKYKAKIVLDLYLTANGH